MKARGSTELVIPNGYTSIDNAAFYGMSKLKSIELPKNVESVDNNAFEGCGSLCEIIVPEAAYNPKNKAFEGFKKVGTSHLIHKKLILRR